LSEIQRMQELVEDLIKLSHVSHTPINTEKIDLTGLIEEIISNLHQSHPERNVVTKVQEGLTIKADKGLITVALENLLGNAWKFTALKEVGEIEFGGMKKDGEKVFFIRDNGAGFDMKFADKLFLPFQRFHSAQEFPGTGIGLSTVHRIIQRHGGKIWAESQPGKGTTLYFSI
jgi:signal transduction histidine kinase